MSLYCYCNYIVHNRYIMNQNNTICSAKMFEYIENEEYSDYEDYEDYDFDIFYNIEDFLIYQDKLFMRKIFYVASDLNKN
nr:hypothetical protein [Megavirus caiporensis]